MLAEYENSNGHDKFKELSALANASELTADEWTQLKEHLRVCEACRELHGEYLILDREGMRMLAADRSRADLHPDWDDTATRTRLFARVREAEASMGPAFAAAPPSMHAHLLARIAGSRVSWAAAALCVISGMAVGTYRFGARRASANATNAQVAAENRIVQTLVTEKRAISGQLEEQTRRLSQLEAEATQKEQALSKLRAELQVEDARLSNMTASKATTEGQLRAALQQRDSLSARLQTAEQNYEAARAELVALRTEHERATLRLTSLESENNALRLANRDQEHRLKNSEQYLSSDRDIRELMGARKLYIADVYDIDSRSQTRKPFGRVFYTHGKSLIFYAFDLDRQPGLKNASGSAFQVWGKKGSDEGQPLNLGILYQDSEANRRWVLRFDDPKQLAEINAVFVTVEPNGGSLKPTSKPFLYALLRKEANHP